MPAFPSSFRDRMVGRILILLAAIGVLGWSPAQAQDRPSNFLRESDGRVAEIGYRLARGGLAFCSSSYPLTGLALHHLGEYEVGDRPAAAEAFGLAAGPAVQGVVDASPAAAAGLRTGDILTKVGDMPVPQAISPDSEIAPKDARRPIEATESAIEAALAGGARRVTVTRGGIVMTFDLAPEPGCPGRVRLARSSQLNAFANRGYAIVTTAMLDFVRNDDELAIVMAHEMAHVILGHPEMLREEGVPRGLLRHFGSNAARIRETERAADQLGIKLAWASGFDVSAAIPFWRRYSARRGPQIATTHPGLATRLQIISEAIAALHESSMAPSSGDASS